MDAGLARRDESAKGASRTSRLVALPVRGERLGARPQEEAFCETLADNEGAVRAVRDPKLRIIAQEIVTAMRKNTSVDWTIRDSVRARIRVVVKRILEAHGLPPDLQNAAVKLVLERAETLCRDWAGE
jgi:type I restriction enzyme, R subunit